MELKTKIKRRFVSLKEFLLNKKSRSKSLKAMVELLYQEHSSKLYRVPSVSLKALVPNLQIQLPSYLPKEGNLSPQELIVIGLITQYFKPTKIVEIGTFNGLSALCMALNSPASTSIHTLDLDPNVNIDLKHVWKEDLKYIYDQTKRDKVYAHFSEKAKITAHLGDSLSYDFTRFGLADFIFIDGGHHFSVVASDTEKALSILKPYGLILWHDYSCHCEGVFDYLNDLNRKLPLQHIQGTSLVIYKKDYFL